MEFSIDKKHLLKPLEEVLKAVPNKPPIPILTNIMFEVNESGLTLLAGDGNLFIQAHVEPEYFEFVSAGKLAVTGKLIMDIIKKIGSDVTVKAKGFQVSIQSGRSCFELSGVDPEEFPIAPEVPNGTISVSSILLKTMIAKTFFAVYNKDDYRILNGIHFQFSPNQINLTATNRHRMAQVLAEVECEREVSASIENLDKLMKILDVDTNIELSLSMEWFVAKSKEFTLYSRLLEGVYPDIQKMIPNKFNTTIKVNRNELLKAFELVGIIAEQEDGKVKRANLVIGDELEINSKPEGSKKVVDFVECITIDGEKFTLAVNVKYMQDALKAIDENEVIIKLKSPLDPFVISGLNNHNETQLLLPYRIS
ncbi:DNA polymerase III subunit beta [Paenibacillus radicis (ex Xue et al. 2023)]|uniref:Beta sliding clamp n=1 Tax=Paenibacillus radicis (ex Xue et al. 2023) TaxID=2972489 RepID=A0ABT1YKG2_9BACL|nr:DNA polymerase III subunit beta [Paenibacillus radicis (ex Xue et al. 2023)]MCR8633462.1 DNA polymerase III subunit beta [Paenibacillus radicis (ex Xue et al. 2023)]